MIIRAVKCRVCGDVITSRANHDHNSCRCKSLSVDGGMLDEGVWGMTRVIGIFATKDFVTLDLPITELDLYNDWNKGENKYAELSQYVNASA